MTRPKTIFALAGLAVLAGATVARIAADPPRSADRGKRKVELPLKVVVNRNSASSPDAANPQVEPGRVKWHPTLEAARAAARTSKKPVLLFQMMGNLDHRFC